MRDRGVVPKDVHTQIPGICEYVFLQYHWMGLPPVKTEQDK